MEHKISKEVQKRNKRYDCVFNVIAMLAIIGFLWLFTSFIEILFVIFGV